MKSAGRRKGKNKAEDAKAVLAKIAEMRDADRDMARRLHDLITAAAPDLAPRLWYGMPAYAKDDKVLCFVQIGSKFGTRYTTLGFSDTARLDEGAMWPSAYALTAVTDDVEAQVAALVKRAVG